MSIQPKTLFFLLIAVLIVISIFVMVQFEKNEGNKNNADENHLMKNMNLTRSITAQVVYNQSSILPVIFTEKIAAPISIDEITVKKIVVVNDYLDNQSNLSPLPRTTFFLITDKDGNNIIDWDRHSPRESVSSDIGEFAYARCNEDNDKTQLFFSPSETIPIKNSTQIFVKYHVVELQPTAEGIYHLRFSSLYNTTIELPINAIVEKDDRKLCSINLNEFSKAFFYDINFRMS